MRRYKDNEQIIRNILKVGISGFYFLCFMLLLLLFSSPLSAQEKLLPIFHFNRLTTADGLPTNEIRSNVVRDKLGFAWFGTGNGLVRFDGHTCKVYHPKYNDQRSLSSNMIFALHIDHRNRFWIGTSVGINLYDWESDGFIRLLPRMNDTTWLQDNWINFMYEDRYGTMWFGTERGVVRADVPNDEYQSLDSVKQHIRFRSFHSEQYKNIIFDINEWDADNVLVASMDGLFTINRHSGLINPSNLSMEGNIRLDTVCMAFLIWENSNNLWIGTRYNGLFLFEKDKKKLTRYDPQSTSSQKYPVWFATLDSSKRIWMGTQYGGLRIFDLNTRSSIDYIPYDVALGDSIVVRHISYDRTGIIWISTEQNSLFFLAKNTFRLPNYGLRGASGMPRGIGTVDPGSDGSYWINSEGWAINLDLASLKVKKSVDIFQGQKVTYGQPSAYDSFVDSNGVIWYGSWGPGLFKFTPKTGEVKNFKYTSKKENICWSIYPDVNDNIWIAAYDGGLYKFHKKNEKFSNVSDMLLSHISDKAIAVLHVMVDPTNKLWIADELKGLFVYDLISGAMEHFEHISDDTTSLSHNRIRRVYRDPKGKIWIGAEILNLWDPETKTSRKFYNPEFSDASLAIPLGSDHQDRLWVSYLGKRLGVLDPATGIFTNFGSSNGLCGSPYDMKLLNDGRILLVGSRGMNIVNPESLLQLAPPPSLMITRMTINDSLEISPYHLSTDEFSYQQNVIELEFAAFEPGATHLIEYQYRLEGWEDNWVQPKDRRFVRYTGLDHGDYVFRVKARNKHDRWIDQEISLAITILPPWWQTWWAYTLYGLAFIGLLYSGYRIRLRQVRLTQQVEMEHFQTEHLAEVDRLKSRFFSNISHEFRTPLTLILGPAEQMMDQSKDLEVRRKSHLIKNNAKKLLGLVNQLLDFSRLESGVMKLQVSSGDVI